MTLTIVIILAFLFAIVLGVAGGWALGKEIEDWYGK